MAGALLELLSDQCDRERVTVFWHCGDKTLCTTGKLKLIGDDFVAVWGRTPTVAERHSDCECKDFCMTEALTIIPAESICGGVLEVPECRQAVPPMCCGCPEHGHH